MSDLANPQELARRLRPYWPGTFWPLEDRSWARRTVASLLRVDVSDPGVRRATDVLQIWEQSARPSSVKQVAREMIKAFRDDRNLHE